MPRIRNIENEPFDLCRECYAHLCRECGDGGGPNGEPEEFSVTGTDTWSFADDIGEGDFEHDDDPHVEYIYSEADYECDSCGCLLTSVEAEVK